ncbi:hypothetical protein EPI10_021317 [Gossypium australe]|uniref:Uncharacterized protein n=1 Tax=Gossypium australe TaxID=47621 RepID=A0A5B6WGW9_9ROSI|nr:hypothetical protein EPI10_021317 [Gossypium australe]
MQSLIPGALFLSIMLQKESEFPGCKAPESMTRSVNKSSKTTGCGDQASFPVFGVPHGAVNYHVSFIVLEFLYESPFQYASVYDLVIHEK